MHESWKSGLEFKIQLLLLSFHPKKEKLRRFKGHCIKGWGEGEFSYSRFFAVGLFRLLCAALNINKRSVDWDLDVYCILLSELLQVKELLKEYIDKYASNLSMSFICFSLFSWLLI
ncbi:Protein THYLAKOID FORMATION1, chloroplastic [Glycine max]|nr:Protein THYLAKOID FORMATION1, chloroplastic [Glycine max]